MNARFDLEQQIFECWNIVEELKLLQENVIEGDLTKENDPHGDKLANILLGLEQLYQLKFDRCFRTFEQYIKE